MHKAVFVIITLIISISLTANSVQAQGFWDWVLSIFSPSTTPAGAFEILVPLLACSDSDLGRFYDVKGETELLIKGKIITETDSCDGDVLTEYYCDILHTSILSTTVNCKEYYRDNYFCHDGACKEGIEICSGGACIISFTNGEYVCSGSEYCDKSFPGECGDTNADGVVDVNDIIYLINHVFRDGPAPRKLGSGDVNSDNELDLGDIRYLIDYVLRRGPAPFCKEPDFIDLSVRDIVFLPNENPEEGDTRTVRAVIENLGNLGDSFIVDYAITDPDGVEDSVQVRGSVGGGSETSVDTSVVLDVAGTWTFSVSVTPDTYSDQDMGNNVRAESISVSEEQGDEPDTTPPAVTLNYPQNNAHVSEGNVVFRYTPSDPNLYACYFWAGSETENIWEMIETDNNPISDTENTFTLLTYVGSYIWNIQCIDSNDNIGWGENFSIDFDITPNNPPTTPTSLTPTTGTYDINNSVISIECSGSTDTDGDSVFYTIYAYYDSSWKTLEHGGDGEYDWTISRISSQSDVDLRCQATDLTDASSYFNPEGKLEIDTVNMEDKQTHFTCQNQQCAEVEGSGSDSCSSDYDCEALYCGDGECDSWETPDTCSEDCEQGIYIDTEDGQYTSEASALIKIFQLSDTKNGVRAIAIATDTENSVKDIVIEVFKEGTFQTRSSKECNSEVCTIIKDFDYGPGGYSVFLSVTNGANLTYNISKNYVFKTGYCGDGFCRGNETDATCSQDCESRVNMGVSEATLISNIESVRDKINDSEQINLMSYVLLQVADKFDIIHSREISIAARGFFYGISQFFCFQIDTELKDAEFFSDMASEIEKIRALLSFLSGEIGSKEIKNEIFDIDVDLFTKIKDLKEKYTSKQQTAGGICGGRELGS